MLSPDEKQAVVAIRGANTDLWLIDLARSISTRFTFDPGRDLAPVWSPDGSHIAFVSDRNGSYDLYQKISSGAGKHELLLKSGNPKFTKDWSPDGFLLYEELDPKTRYDLMLLPLSGDKKPVPFLQTEFNERDGAFSPDGKWIAYASDESGKDEIYVQPFPATGAKWQVSKSGGFFPKWRRDGKELFFKTRTGIMAAEVKTGAIFQAGVPQALFEVSGRVRGYSVTRDGQRFLMPAGEGETRVEPATVAINWMAGIKR